MKATVNNFRAVPEAEISVSPIALLCGLNGAGKTSIARAVAAALTGRALPFSKMTKKDCAILLRHGTHTGSVTLESAEGSTTVTWPDAETKSTGLPPCASEVAAGLTDIFSMKPDQALSYLINLLKADATKADIAAHLEKAEFEPDVAERVWKAVEEKGWQAAHARAVTKGQELKGAWQQISGESFGVKKASTWHPAGWEDRLLNVEPQDLHSAIDQKQKDLESAIGRSAVSRSERDALEQQVKDIGSVERAISDTRNTLDKKKAELEEVKAKLRESPNPLATEEQLCPHCGKGLHIKPTGPGKVLIVKSTKTNAAKAKEEALAHAGLSGDMERLAGEAGTLARSLTDMEKDLNVMKDGQKKLESMPQTTDEGDPEEVRKIRETLSKLKAEEGMIQRKRDADIKAANIASNQILIDMLDESGLRKKKLSESLDAFMSNYIDPLCEDFGIPTVAIDADLNVDLGQTPYPMLSASEQFRVRTILQLAIAQMEKASLVIIDGADILDAAGRRGLFNTIQTCAIPAIICMTLNKVEQAPDLQESELGTTYWIDRGKCSVVSHARKAA